MAQGYYQQPQYPTQYQPQLQYQPQYPQQQQYQPQPLPGYATSPNPSYGQPQPMSRTLHVYHEGFTQRHAKILDSNKATQLYSIDLNSGGCFSSKPHIKIHHASTNAQVGTVTFHSWSSDMDLTIHNQPIQLKKAGMMSSTFEFHSPATGGSFKWKRDGMWSSDMLCLDQREQLIARFSSSNWAMKKDGKIELSPGVQGVLMDEIVVSGFAMIEHKIRQSRASAGAAGGGGAAAAIGC